MVGVTLFSSFLGMIALSVSLFSFLGFEPVTPVAADENARELRLRIRDSLTGKIVIADVQSTDILGKRIAATSDRGTLALRASSRSDLTVQANGYDSMRTYFGPADADRDVTIWLDPIGLEQRLSSTPIETEGRTSFVEGYVYHQDGQPFFDATVTFRGVSSRTDATGYFRLTFESPRPVNDGELPEQADLEVRHRGELVYLRAGMPVEQGRTSLIVDISPASVSVDGRHKMRMSAEEVVHADQQIEIEEPLFVDAPVAVAVPQSIRVGSSCATATTCTSVNVYSIDTYVRNGLDDEWIASWNANSVKAGAIAYRSYGAYHVFHPRVPASYDICNTTSCQVNDPSDTHVNSNNATTQTTGTIVTNAAGTDALFAEYSAENNLAPGCPDGSTGRPEHNWPCLADPVDVGTTYFGHGRGMCQWGSQRWAINQGKDFVWIVNHYYNANGNPSGLRSGVLQMGPDTLLPPPGLVLPGDQAAPGPTVTTLTPTFSWAAVAGADGYSLYVSRFNGSTYDVVFNSETALGQPITSTSFTLPSGILVGGAQYRWNMSSHIPAGYGTPNTFRNYFTVSTTVSVSGRVTTPSGAAIRNAVVSLTDDLGVRRTATTSSFGLFSFSGVGIGRTYTITVANKRYRFTAQVVQASSDLSDITFVGQE